MSRLVRIIVIIVVILLIGAAAGALYLYLSGGSGQASAEISAPTLPPEPTSAPAAEATQADATAEATAETAASAAVLFDIVPNESQVSFELDEVLRGTPTTVVGTTDQIAGQLRIDPSNPQAAEVGTIRINVRTLATDQEMRNRTIRGQILLSAQDQFEFAEFAPTEITGMPESVSVGETFTFQLTGNLTLKGITQPVTFDVSVTPISETRIEGTATATVTRSQFELQIPSVPGVADVEEDVLLTINFVAVAEA